MKNIFIKYGIFLFLIVGCSSVLEEEIVSGITADTYYVDEKGMEDALVSAYAELKSEYGTLSGIALHKSGTDLYGAARSGRTRPEHNYDGTHNPAHASFAQAWRVYYRGINICNTILNRAPSVVTDTNQLNRILAEARYLRAFNYFQLVQNFGDVTMTTEETVTAEIEATRTAASKIYNEVIIPDLEFAMDNLPPSADVGRATEPAAKVIRARVAMVLEDWPLAEILTKSIINDYSFSLTDTYAELWDMDNESNSETIWSIPFSQNPLISGRNRENDLFTPWYTKHPGLVSNAIDGGTWVAFKPTPYFYGLWDKTKDRRYSEGLKSVWRVQNEATALNGAKVGDTALYYSIDVLTPEYKASKPYVIYDVNDLIADDSAWPQPTKVRDESRTNFGINPSRDIVLQRLADIYLVLCEAQFHLGKIPEAVITMNILRGKRALDGKESDMEITASDLTLDFILDERARELFAEGRRWLVLKRLNKLVERVKLYNHYGGQNNIKDFHMLRPIPLEQIERTDNVYPQNPEYN